MYVSRKKSFINYKHGYHRLFITICIIQRLTLLSNRLGSDPRFISSETMSQDPFIVA